MQYNAKTPKTLGPAWRCGLSLLVAARFLAMNNLPGMEHGGAALKRDSRMVSYAARKLIGSRVQLKDLQKRADLNGMEGEVEDYHDSSARYMIQLDN